MPINILIADDHGIVRSGLINELKDHKDMAVIGEAINGDEAWQLTKKFQPDILILDINMQGLKAIQLLSKLQRSEHTTRVIVFTASDDPITIKEMLRAGAQGYILKGDDPEDLVKAIHSVMNGKSWLSPTVADFVVGILFEDKIVDNPWVLTDREIRILQMLSWGYRSEQIGGELSIAKRTVNYHIEQIYHKLKAKNRAEAIAKAFRYGLIRP